MSTWVVMIAAILLPLVMVAVALAFDGVMAWMERRKRHVAIAFFVLGILWLAGAWLTYGDTRSAIAFWLDLALGAGYIIAGLVQLIRNRKPANSVEA